MFERSGRVPHVRTSVHGPITILSNAFAPCHEGFSPSEQFFLIAGALKGLRPVFRPMYAGANMGHPYGVVKGQDQGQARKARTAFKPAEGEGLRQSYFYLRGAGLVRNNVQITFRVRLGKLMVGGSRPLHRANTVAADSIAPAAPSVWPCIDLVELTGKAARGCRRRHGWPLTPSGHWPRSRFRGH